MEILNTNYEHTPLNVRAHEINKSFKMNFLLDFHLFNL